MKVSSAVRLPCVFGVVTGFGMACCGWFHLDCMPQKAEEVVVFWGRGGGEGSLHRGLREAVPQPPHSHPIRTCARTPASKGVEEETVGSATFRLAGKVHTGGGGAMGLAPNWA